jgi:probable HAF family extracellular repeat protein
MTRLQDQLRRLVLASAVLGLMVGAARQARAGLSFSFTPFDVLGGGGPFSYGINDSGQIAGTYSDATGTHGFVEDGAGNYTSINVPGAIFTDALGINDSGQIVGLYDATGIQGFLKTGSVFTPIDVPGAAEGTYSWGISNNGQVVGYYLDASGVEHGFLRDGAGNYSSINIPGSPVVAYGINDSGQIVGGYYNATGWHSFLMAGGFTPIVVPGAKFTSAFGINDSGQIVGSYEDASGVEHGFLKTGSVFTTIDAPGAGASATYLWGINDSGQIVGTYDDASGDEHGFIATPVPEPATVVMIATGLPLGLVFWCWKRRHAAA